MGSRAGGGDYTPPSRRAPRDRRFLKPLSMRPGAAGVLLVRPRGSPVCGPTRRCGLKSGECPEFLRLTGFVRCAMVGGHEQLETADGRWKHATNGHRVPCCSFLRFCAWMALLRRVVAVAPDYGWEASERTSPVGNEDDHGNLRHACRSHVCVSPFPISTRPSRNGGGIASPIMSSSAQPKPRRCRSFSSRSSRTARRKMTRGRSRASSGRQARRGWHVRRPL